MTAIARDEWLRALGDAAQPVNPDALSTTEIAEMFGISISAAQRQAKRLVREKRALETVKLSPNGRRVPAFLLVKKK